MTSPMLPPPPFADRIATLDREPIVIQGSRAKAILLLMTCLLLVGAGIFAIVQGETEGLVLALPAVLIFGLGMLVAAIQIARPALMTIARDGVTVRTIMRSWTVRWDQVQGFFVFKPPAMRPPAGLTMGDMAAFKWAGAPPARRRWVRIGRILGADGGFGPGWPLSPQDLTDLLNAAREKAISPAAPRKSP